MKKPGTFRKMVTVALMLAVGSFSTLLTSTASAQTAQKAAGELSVRGNVTLNGLAAISGATVFSNGTIKTGDNGFATVNLGKQGRVELAPNSEMVLSFGAENVGGTLRSGRTTVSAPAGIGISVVTADGNAVADGRQAAVMVVDITCGNTRVMAARSDAKVTAGNKVEYVAAGQEVSVGSQQAPRCTRLAATAAAAGGAGGAAGLSAGAVAALIIAGVGGAVAGVVAASQSDSTSSSSVVVSNFRP